MSADNEGASPKSSKKKFVLVGVALVLIAGAAAGGVVLGPQLMGGDAEAEKNAEPAKVSDIVQVSVAMAPIIVDARNEDGAIRHLKVALALEPLVGVTEADLKNYLPRGRESAITFLRSQSFEALTDPKRFEQLRQELSKRIIDAVGTERVGRVLVTDFVAQ